MKGKFNTKDITEPKQGLVVYKDAYWVCVNGDPKQALFYGNSPQCNRDKRIHEWIMKNGKYADGRTDLQIIFIETAFVPKQD